MCFGSVQAEKGRKTSPLTHFAGRSSFILLTGENTAAAAGLNICMMTWILRGSQAMGYDNLVRGDFGSCTQPPLLMAQKCGKEHKRIAGIRVPKLTQRLLSYLPSNSICPQFLKLRPQGFFITLYTKAALRSILINHQKTLSIRRIPNLPSEKEKKKFEGQKLNPDRQVSLIFLLTLSRSQLYYRYDSQAHPVADDAEYETVEILRSLHVTKRSTKLSR